MRIIKCTCDFCGYSEEVPLMDSHMTTLPVSHVSNMSSDVLTHHLARAAKLHETELEWCEPCATKFQTYVKHRWVDIVNEAINVLKAGADFDKELKELIK
jgi:hypothetical protein